MNRHLWLVATDDIIRDAVRLALPHDAKVLMQARLCSDGSDDRITERIDFIFRDIAIPFVIRRHEQGAAEIGIRSGSQIGMLCQRQAGEGEEEQNFHGGSKIGKPSLA